MKQLHFFVINLLLLLFLAVYFLLLSQKVEGFTEDKIQLIDWWDDESSKKIFEKIFSGIFDKYDKIRVYNCAGNSEIEKHPRILNVQYSGESYYREPTDFDINFIPVDETARNIHIFPYGSLHLLSTDYYELEELINPRIYSPKTNFCLFAVSNGTCQQRNEMFTELSKYKKVDSCGRFMNNMDKPCPGNWWEKEYCEFISQYKFMICFENTSQPNYLTEKCINAFYCGTIPIYWGCTNLDEHINVESILYLPPNAKPEEREALIQKIIYLDNNEEAYREMYEKPFFKNGILPPSFDINQIRKNVENALK